MATIDPISWLDLPLSELLANLWLWPGHSDYVEIHIAQPVLTAIWVQASSIGVECGGYLLGRHFIFRDPGGVGRHVVVILNLFRIESETRGGAEFDFSVATRMRDMERIASATEFRSLDVVGWYHSHHNRGAFLSPTVDQPLHRRFFAEPYQVACVVDPKRREGGFFIWEGSDLVAGRNECLALFNPLTLEILSQRRGRKVAPKWEGHLRQFWINQTVRDGAMAATSLILGLAGFMYAISNRPFLAWTLSGGQIRWEQAATGPLGYAVYRSNDGKNNGHEFVRKTSADLSVNLEGADKDLQAAGDRGKRFWYRIAALDASARPIRWSRPVPLVIPVDRRPAPPDGKYVINDTRDRVKLSFSPYATQDGLGFWLIREGPLTEMNRKILMGGKPIPSSQSRTSVEDHPGVGGAYRYVVIPQDWSGNLGDPWDTSAVAMSGREAARFF